MNIGKMMIYVVDRSENIVGKGENAVYQHFLLFPQCFRRAFSSGVLKVRIVWERVKLLFHRAWLRYFEKLLTSSALAWLCSLIVDLHYPIYH